MTTSVSVMVVAVFLASLVEMVEALTIVVAVGATRGWRTALEGVVAALGALCVLVVVFGPTLTSIPLNSLRLIVGAFLLVFGMQWLRKAILRSAGLKAKHDEDAIYADTVASLSSLSQRDTAGFVTSFKGVFLEGVEVVVTVITLGSPSHRILMASGAALLAVVVVTLAGLVVSRHLSRVPENGFKMTVGLMLMAYGTFWVGEGLGFQWPNGEAAILELAGFYALATASVIPYLRNSATVAQS
ncbi:MAG: hypothetical protein KJS64_04830 [Acidobacteria bacterium]|nr:hypothetical protein [Acidobacteriota bacterium]